MNEKPVQKRDIWESKTKRVVVYAISGNDVAIRDLHAQRSSTITVEKLLKSYKLVERAGRAV